MVTLTSLSISHLLIYIKIFNSFILYYFNINSLYRNSKFNYYDYEILRSDI